MCSAEWDQEGKIQSGCTGVLPLALAVLRELQDYGMTSRLQSFQSFLLPGPAEGVHQTKGLPDLLRFHWISGKNQILEVMDYGHHPLGCSTGTHFLGEAKFTSQ